MEHNCDRHRVYLLSTAYRQTKELQENHVACKPAQFSLFDYNLTTQLLLNRVRGE